MKHATKLFSSWFSQPTAILSVPVARRPERRFGRLGVECEPGRRSHAAKAGGRSRGHRMPAEASPYI